ncbi:HET-domain-containing protein [Hyaloscypha variabilis F]|uniref:HET-domain-containing protein n=1 Tax=Hyaloscypha variabilis (strain UAMH 11265 / GT02V1 / F) TaxID=1149755 RepID=A0A2J6RLP9_HYAVF|nr:HET-domain-containing protein [Hyaloscypha variabilis F]
MWTFLHPNTLSSYYVSPVPDAEPLPTNGRTLNTLCATCTRTLRSPEWTLDSKKHLVDGRPHHPSFQALYEAAKAGCHICTLFWDAMHRNPPDDRRIVEFGSASQEMVLKFLEHPSNRRDIQLDVREICDWRLEIASFSEKENWHTRGSQYHDGQGWGSEDEVIPWIPLELDPASQTIFKKIENWISECLGNHKNCQNSASATARLPTRMLDVGPSDGSRVPFLLSDTHKLPPKDHKYIALTHRWPQPGEKMLTTTTNTLSERSRGISLNLLPKTFQDAILITRKLNIQYLWIDSLCIVQDSHKDWEQEAARMHLVYRDAYLTISADAGTAGCLIPRDPLAIRPCMLENSFGEPGIGVLPHPFGDFRASIDEGLLSTRGWIVQERLLSCRILHFAQHEVYWECITITASERHPSHPEKSFEAQFGTMKQLLKQIQLPLKVSTENQFSSELFTEYYDFIQHYTQREFTIATDKLPALSGIVQSVYEHLNPQVSFQESYLAGLWRQDLLAGLLWEVRPIDETGRFRNPDLRPKAPSWSWSSVDEEVVYMNARPPGDYLSHFSAQVVAADVVLTGVNPAGAVNSGRLVLKGALKRAFEEGDEMEKLALMMGAKMDLPIDDALEIEEMWLLRIFAWKDELTKREDRSNSASENSKDGSEHDERTRQGVTGRNEEVGADERGHADDTVSNSDENDGLSDVDDDFETDEWANALILVPAGEGTDYYRRVGLVSMWPNSVFTNEEEFEVTII